MVYLGGENSCSSQRCVYTRASVSQSAALLAYGVSIDTLSRDCCRIAVIAASVGGY
jgi:hypothetical protein